MACPVSKEPEYFLDILWEFLFPFRNRSDGFLEDYLGVIGKLLGDLAWRQDKIYHPGIDGTLGHPGVLGGVEKLGDGQTRFGLDRLQSKSAIRARARKDDADSPFFLVLR